MSSRRTRSGGRHRAADVPRTASRAGVRRSRSARAAAVGVAAVAATSTVGGVLAGPALAEEDSSGGAASSTAETIGAGPDGSDGAGAGGVDETPAAEAARAEPRVPGTPCSASARACVDLESQRAWLIEGGTVTRGPMRVSSGAGGEETPVGHSFRVYRQDEDHVSGESTTRDGRPAPMPYSTFFADGGVAFHAGDPDRASAGCIRMETDDARALFGELENGDKVQVVNASEEQEARARS